MYNSIYLVLNDIKIVYNTLSLKTELTNPVVYEYGNLSITYSASCFKISPKTIIAL